MLVLTLVPLFAIASGRCWGHYLRTPSRRSSSRDRRRTHLIATQSKRAPPRGPPFAESSVTKWTAPGHHSKAWARFQDDCTKRRANFRETRGRTRRAGRLTSHARPIGSRPQVQRRAITFPGTGLSHWAARSLRVTRQAT
jgi:hypothetical protein